MGSRMGQKRPFLSHIVGTHLVLMTRWVPTSPDDYVDALIDVAEVTSPENLFS